MMVMQSWGTAHQLSALSYQQRLALNKRHLRRRLVSCVRVCGAAAAHGFTMSEEQVASQAPAAA